MPSRSAWLPGGVFQAAGAAAGRCWPLQAAAQSSFCCRPPAEAPGLTVGYKRRLLPGGAAAAPATPAPAPAPAAKAAAAPKAAPKVGPRKNYSATQPSPVLRIKRLPPGMDRRAFWFGLFLTGKGRAGAAGVHAARACPPAAAAAAAAAPAGRADGHPTPTRGCCRGKLAQFGRAHEPEFAESQAVYYPTSREAPWPVYCSTGLQGGGCDSMWHALPACFAALRCAALRWRLHPCPHERRPPDRPCPDRPARTAHAALLPSQQSTATSPLAPPLQAWAARTSGRRRPCQRMRASFHGAPPPLPPPAGVGYLHSQ